MLGRFLRDFAKAVPISSGSFSDIDDTILPAALLITGNTFVDMKSLAFPKVLDIQGIALFCIQGYILSSHTGLITLSYIFLRYGAANIPATKTCHQCNLPLFESGISLPNALLIVSAALSLTLAAFSESFCLRVILLSVSLVSASEVSGSFPPVLLYLYFTVSSGCSGLDTNPAKLLLEPTVLGIALPLESLGVKTCFTAFPTFLTPLNAPLATPPITLPTAFVAFQAPPNAALPIPNIVPKA